MKKILVICDAGEVRSVAMAKELRERGHFAVAGALPKEEDVLKEYGIKKRDRHFDIVEHYISIHIKPFYDEIIFMQEGGTDFIGRAEWGDIDNLELIRKCKELANNRGF